MTNTNYAVFNSLRKLYFTAKMAIDHRILEKATKMTSQEGRYDETATDKIYGSLTIPTRRGNKLLISLPWINERRGDVIFNYDGAENKIEERKDIFEAVVKFTDNLGKAILASSPSNHALEGSPLEGKTL